MKITILGSGTSGGVPFVGCKCEVCTSDHPKNKRRRASILVETQGKRILIDTSPDLRMQALDNDLATVDAVLFTHAHADHTHGIDDIRSFNHNANQPIDAYGDAETMAFLQKKFEYVFMPPVPEKGWYRPCLAPNIIEHSKAFDIDGVEIIPFKQQHGKGFSVGFRIGNMAYSTDTNGFPEESLPYLQGLDCWIVTALQYKPHATHAHVDMTLEWVEQFKPKQTILTHMAHAIDYVTLQEKLPNNIIPAYDNMAVDL